MKRAATAPAVALCALLGSGAASGGVFRAYLSVNGSDANPCTVQKPCRLLPAALAAVNDGGEVWILDSANFNTDTVNVTKSVTILAVPGALGSLVAPKFKAALMVRGDPVTLRNLNVRNLDDRTDTIGVGLTTASKLRIEHCAIYGVDFGISLQGAGSSSTIVNTTIHDTGIAVHTASATHVSIDGSSIGNSSEGVLAQEGARVTVSNTTLTDNGIAIEADSFTSPLTVVDVARSTISASDTGIGFGVVADSGTLAEIFVQSTTVHASIGFSFGGQGGTEKIYSYGDNPVIFYSALVQGLGTLTPIPKL